MAKGLVTPAGVAKYCWLNTPNTKYKKEGEYQVTLVLDPDELAVKEMMEEIKKLADETFNTTYNKLKGRAQKELGKWVPFAEEEDKEGEPTGKVEFKFKQSSTYEDEPRSIPMFDRKGNPLPEEKKVFSGSVLRVNYTMSSSYNEAQKKVFVTLYIRAVQVLTFGEGSGAGGFGFDVEEGEAEEQNIEPADNEDDIPF